MNVSDSFNSFILSRKLADLSPKTIKAYEMFVKPFVDCLGLDKALCDVRQCDIDNYIYSVMCKPVSKSTRATYIRHLKVFVKWCCDNYSVCFDYKSIRVPKSPKKNLKIYTTDEMRLIFNSVVLDAEWLEFRNKSIIALMYDSGLRQSEICTLKRDNISFNKSLLTVLGKGNKERTVPLGNISKEFLRIYLRICPFVNECVFVTRYGEPLSNNAVKLMMSKLSRSLPFDLSSHKLRHNFATNYCIDSYSKRGNVDIYKLMILLGHEDIETTRRYLHHANEIIACSECISHLDLIFEQKK